MINEKPDPDHAAPSVDEVVHNPALAAWEITLAEVAQRFPMLGVPAFPSPIPATVPLFIRHLIDVGADGPRLGGVTDEDGGFALVGGIEGGMRRLLQFEGEDPTGFFEGEVQAMLTVKERWGRAFERLSEPFVREATTWAERQWPIQSKDQVALFAEYLSKDPPIVHALVATVALGLRDASKPADGRQSGRRIEQAERRLREYFVRRGCSSYRDLVHATVTACLSPAFGIVPRGLLDVAANALTAEEERTATLAFELLDLIKEHEEDKAAKQVDVGALRRERDQAVAAAREEGMTASVERVRALEARVRELEGQLDTIRRRESRERAWLAEQRAREERDALAKTAPAPAPAPIVAKDEPIVAVAPTSVRDDAARRRLLAGRRVFLYTNKRRGGAREAFYTELLGLGAPDPKVYETKGSVLPGPTTFPPNSVVIVDTSFMSHTHSNLIRRRARASEETLFLEDGFGVAGLAQRLASLIERQSGDQDGTD